MSNRQFEEVQLIERHEAVHTGIGTVAAVRTRTVAEQGLREGDVIVAWVTTSGRVASHENRVRSSRVAGRLMWVEVDSEELLREVTFSSP